MVFSNFKGGLSRIIEESPRTMRGWAVGWASWSMAYSIIIHVSKLPSVHAFVIFCV